LNADTIVKDEAVSMQDKIEEKTNAFLQRFESEDVKLMGETKKVHSLREKRQLKIEKIIESKRKSIKKLRAEIHDLKIDCEKLSVSVWASLHRQNPELISKKNFKQAMKNKGYSEKAIEEIWKWYDNISNT
jgi:uncharacterized protein YlxW (UPF0749 family)